MPIPWPTKRRRSLPIGVSNRNPPITSRDGSFSSLVQDVEAHQVLGLLGGGPLGEVHDVDRRQVGRRAARRWTRAAACRGRRSRAAPAARSLCTTTVGRPVRRSSSSTKNAGSPIVADISRNWTCGSASSGTCHAQPRGRIGVEVELVDDHPIDRGVRPVAQRHVGQDLGGAADDGRVGVDRGVTGDHAHVVGAEGLAQLEELLGHQRLDRRGVEAALTAGDGCEVCAVGHQGLARTGGSGEHHVMVGEQLEDGLLLRRVQLDSIGRDPRKEPVEEVVGVAVRGRDEVGTSRRGAPRRGGSLGGRVAHPGQRDGR